jgi:hypothetical protein
MPLAAGELDSDANFIDPDCMAKFIDDAIAQITPLPSTLTPDVVKKLQLGQRNTWIGISTGIIAYLKAHAGDSFEITVTTSATGDKATLTIL